MTKVGYNTYRPKEDMTNQTLTPRYKQRRINLLEEEWIAVDKLANEKKSSISQALSEIIAHWANSHI